MSFTNEEINENNIKKIEKTVEFILENYNYFKDYNKNTLNKPDKTFESLKAKIFSFIEKVTQMEPKTIISVYNPLKPKGYVVVQFLDDSEVGGNEYFVNNSKYYHIYNVLGNNMGMWVCSECIINEYNKLPNEFKAEYIAAEQTKRSKTTEGKIKKEELDKLREKHTHLNMKELLKIIKNLRTKYRAKILDDEIQCHIHSISKDSKGNEIIVDQIHYCLKEEIKRGAPKLDSPEIKEIIKNFYGCMDAFKEIEYPIDDLEVDHRISQFMMNTEEVDSHNWVVKKLMSIKSDLINIEDSKKLRDKLLNINIEVNTEEINECYLYKTLLGRKEKIKGQGEVFKLGELIFIGINNFFQLLTSDSNKLKYKYCEICQTKPIIENYKEVYKRQYPYGLKYFYDRNGNFNEKAERCKGCFFYNPTLWYCGLKKKYKEEKLSLSPLSQIQKENNKLLKKFNNEITPS